MGKPRLMLLIRHAQSEGNQNRALHQIIPDHRVKLTPEGWQQAKDAGHRLRSLLQPDDTIQIFTSPYRRTKETTEGILSTLTAPADDQTPSPFTRENIKVWEEPRLREQDFGNFQPCSAEMQLMWQERADYGHFFYRIPNGESAADAYDRVAGFNETLFRNFKEDDFPSVCILVTHGLLTRVFLMKWYHWSTSYFEDLKNINHCEFITMRLDAETNKYILENKLRTWSETKSKPTQTPTSTTSAAAALASPALLQNPALDNSIWAGQIPHSPSIPPRMWGGCVRGCNHKYQMHQRRVTSRQGDAKTPTAANVLDDPSHYFASVMSLGTPSDASHSAREINASRYQNRERLGEQGDQAEEAEVHSDGERSYSDHTDLQATDVHTADVQAHIGMGVPAQNQIRPTRRRLSRRQPTIEDVEGWIRESGMGSGARADPLGDEPSDDEQSGDEAENDIKHDGHDGHDARVEGPSRHQETQSAVADVL